MVDKKPVPVDSSVRINEVKGLSILPPPGQGWTIEHIGETQVVFGKKGISPGASYIVQATLFKLPKMESEQEFVKYISQMKTAQQPVERFEMVKTKYDFNAFQSAYCVKHHEVGEDKKAYKTTGNPYMILEVIGNTCQHPKNKAIGVDFGYSYRYPWGGRDPQLEEEAEAFLNAVEFREF